MKKNIIMTVLALVLSVSTLFFAGTPVQAASCGSAKQCIDQGLSASGTSSTPNSLSSVLTTVTNILLFLMGAVSVIMIIIGGFRYVTSQGDQTQTQSSALAPQLSRQVILIRAHLANQQSRDKHRQLVRIYKHQSTASKHRFVRQHTKHFQKALSAGSAGINRWNYE
jgi:hypothetical protein